jgi:L-amino acid N-acyltransferase YncA
VSRGPDVSSAPTVAGDNHIALRLATVADAAAVADIYNQGIEDRGATFETEPRSAEMLAGRIAEDPARHPVVVATDRGRVVGWASISAYRPRACYSGVGEFSVYLDRAARGRGLGKLLVARLVEEARARGYWKLLSRVFTFNEASRALCRACGFREVGVYERHGQLDGRWLDVVIVERLIRDDQP